MPLWTPKQSIGHKFNATPVIHDGFRFASKKEGKRYEELKCLRQAGDVIGFLMQTPFHLGAPNIKYVDDFTVFWANGTVTFEDVKGYRTQQYLLKKRLFEQFYPAFHITEI